MVLVRCQPSEASTAADEVDRGPGPSQAIHLPRVPPRAHIRGGTEHIELQTIQNLQLVHLKYVDEPEMDHLLAYDTFLILDLC